MVNKAAPSPRTIDEYLTLPYSIRVIPATPAGYVATVDELPGCITQSETWAAAGEMVRDAMRAWIETALEDEQPIPEPGQDVPPARMLVRLPRSLHQELLRTAAREGVSLNQFVVYQLAHLAGRTARVTALTKPEESSLTPPPRSPRNE